MTVDTSDLTRVGRIDLLHIIREQEEEIRRLCAPELAKRDLQIAELQTRMTEMVNNGLARRVRAFHLKFGHPVSWTPGVPDEEQIRFRLKLITEEFFELLNACGVFFPFVVADGESVDRRVDEIVYESIFSPFEGQGVNLPEFADALADLDYVVEGTRAVFGIDGEPIMAEVQRANMSKDPVYVATKDTWHRGGAPEGTAPDPTAKPTKPEWWAPPAIRELLLSQGWSGT